MAQVQAEQAAQAAQNAQNAQAAPVAVPVMHNPAKRARMEPQVMQLSSTSNAASTSQLPSQTQQAVNNLTYPAAAHPMFQPAPQQNAYPQSYINQLQPHMRPGEGLYAIFFFSYLTASSRDAVHNSSHIRLCSN